MFEVVVICKPVQKNHEQWLQSDDNGLHHVKSLCLQRPSTLWFGTSQLSFVQYWVLNLGSGTYQVSLLLFYCCEGHHGTQLTGHCYKRSHLTRVCLHFVRVSPSWWQGADSHGTGTVPENFTSCPQAAGRKGRHWAHAQGYTSSHKATLLPKQIYSLVASIKHMDIQGVLSIKPSHYITVQPLAYVINP